MIITPSEVAETTSTTSATPAGRRARAKCATSTHQADAASTEGSRTDHSWKPKMLTEIACSQ